MDGVDASVFGPGCSLTGDALNLWLALLGRRVQRPDYLLGSKLLIVDSYFAARFLAFSSRDSRADIFAKAKPSLLKLPVFGSRLFLVPLFFAAHFSLLALVNANALSFWLERADAAVRTAVCLDRLNGVTDQGNLTATAKKALPPFPAGPGLVPAIFRLNSIAGSHDGIEAAAVMRDVVIRLWCAVRNND